MLWCSFPCARGFLCRALVLPCPPPSPFKRGEWRCSFCCHIPRARKTPPSFFFAVKTLLLLTSSPFFFFVWVQRFFQLFGPSSSHF